jgi:hypothetical protein
MRRFSTTPSTLFGNYKRDFSESTPKENISSIMRSNWRSLLTFIGISSITCWYSAGSNSTQTKKNERDDLAPSLQFYLLFYDQAMKELREDPNNTPTLRILPEVRKAISESNESNPRMRR